MVNRDALGLPGDEEQMDADDEDESTKGGLPGEPGIDADVEESEGEDLASWTAMEEETCRNGGEEGLGGMEMDGEGVEVCLSSEHVTRGVLDGVTATLEVGGTEPTLSKDGLSGSPGHVAIM